MVQGNRMTKKIKKDVLKILKDLAVVYQKDDIKLKFLSEMDVQAYLWKKLKNFGYEVHINPTIDDIDKSKDYNKNAKYINPFFMPDLIISKKGQIELKKSIKDNNKKTGAYQRIKFIPNKQNIFFIEVKLLKILNGESKNEKRYSEICQDFYKMRTNEIENYIVLVVDNQPSIMNNKILLNKRKDNKSTMKKDQLKNLVYINKKGFMINNEVVDYDN
jgi:hypothetical protein